MQRDCDIARELLDARFDGVELEPAAARELEEHLGHCSECARFAASMQEVLQTAAGLADLRYERAVSVAPLLLQPRRAPAWLSWSMAAAAVAAALGVGVLLGRSRTQTVAVRPAAKMVVRLVVPATRAESVAVVGDFTGWNDSIPLEAAGDGLWTGELRLKPGRYRYMLLVDGEHMQPDPAAPQVVDDGFGGKSSVLDVGSI